MPRFCAFGVALPHLQILQLLQPPSVQEDQHPKPPAHSILEDPLFLAIIAASIGILIALTPH
jgi:hypothetical protein